MRPVRPGPRERFRARNGPAIDEWEHTLIGRQVIREDAADTASGPSLHATLEICAKKAQGALSRLPVEIWLRVEKTLHDTVSSLVSHHSDASKGANPDVQTC